MIENIEELEKLHIEIKAQLGEYIREARLRKEMTQGALKEKANVSIQYIIELENGRSGDLKIYPLLKIANALGINVFTLLAAIVERDIHIANESK